MSLATIIRLEFAYPGVGILAGDSIQYLSIATSHGVIMVFFMIMPVVFGAFGNFLLPTQLGVHDVAFPRLNSAAFWFLPGGLIMLCQLVCVDRRYQRMNCFNIRELQGILKRKFFTDLVNTNDHRELFDKSMIGLRFKSNSNQAIHHDMSLFYNFGTTNLSKGKNTLFNQHSTLLDDTNSLDSLDSDVYEESSLQNTPSILNLDSTTLKALVDVFVFHPVKSLTSGFSALLDFLPGSRLFSDFILMNFVLTGSGAGAVDVTQSVTAPYRSSTASPALSFTSEAVTSTSFGFDTSSSMSELSNSLRFTRFNNPLISYDYKCGNYLGI